MLGQNWIHSATFLPEVTVRFGGLDPSGGGQVCPRLKLVQRGVRIEVGKSVGTQHTFFYRRQRPALSRVVKCSGVSGNRQIILDFVASKYSSSIFIYIYIYFLYVLRIILRVQSSSRIRPQLAPDGQILPTA